MATTCIDTAVYSTDNGQRDNGQRYYLLSLPHRAGLILPEPLVQTQDDTLWFVPGKSSCKSLFPYEEAKFFTEEKILFHQVLAYHPRTDDLLSSIACRDYVDTLGQVVILNDCRYKNGNTIKDDDHPYCPSLKLCILEGRDVMINYSGQSITPSEAVRFAREFGIKNLYLDIFTNKSATCNGYTNNLRMENGTRLLELTNGRNMKTYIDLWSDVSVNNTIAVVGPKNVIRISPNLRLPLVNFNNPYVEISDIFQRNPINTLSHFSAKTRFYVSDHNEIWFVRIVKDSIVNTMPEFLNEIGRQSGFGTVQEFSMPVEIFKYARSKIVGLERNTNNFNQLLDAVKRKLIDMGYKSSNVAQTILFTTTMAFLIDLETENTAYETLRKHKEGIEDHSRNRDWNNTPARNYNWVAPLAFGVIGCFVMKRNFVYNSFSVSHVVDKKRLIGGVVALSLTYFIWNAKTFIKPIFKGMSNYLTFKPFHRLNNDCVTQHPPPEMNWELCSHDDTRVEKKVCDRKVACCLVGLAARNRLPVYSCQCGYSAARAVNMRLMPPQTSKFGKGPAPNLYRKNVKELLGEYLPQKITPVSNSVWLSTFDSLKRARYQTKITQNLSEKPNYKIPVEIFVKLEAYFKHSMPTLSLLKPRSIGNVNEDISVVTGPVDHAVGLSYKKISRKKFNKLAYNQDKNFDWTGNKNRLEMLYTSGFNSDELGDLYDSITQKLSRELVTLHEKFPNKEFNFKIIEQDGATWEKSMSKLIQDPIDEEIIDRLDGQLKDHYTQCRNVLKDPVFKYDNKGHFIYAKPGCKQVSGCSATSTGNSVADYCVVKTQCDITFLIYNGYMLVLGDDSLVFLIFSNDKNPNDTKIIKSFVDVGNTLGFVMEVKLHNSFYTPSFCSGYFYPVTRNGERRLMWAPKMGRLISKIGWYKDSKVNPAVYVRSVNYGMRGWLKPIPILSEIYSKHDSLNSAIIDLKGYGIKGIETNIHKPEVFDNNTISPDIYDFFNEVYGLDTIEVSNFCRYIEEIDLPNLLDHPVLDKILEVDVPVSGNPVIGDEELLNATTVNDQSSARLSLVYYFYLKGIDITRPLKLLKEIVKFTPFSGFNFFPFNFYKDEGIFGPVQETEDFKDSKPVLNDNNFTTLSSFIEWFLINSPEVTPKLLTQIPKGSGFLSTFSALSRFTFQETVEIPDLGFPKTDPLVEAQVKQVVEEINLFLKPLFDTRNYLAKLTSNALEKFHLLVSGLYPSHKPFFTLVEDRLSKSQPQWYNTLTRGTSLMNLMFLYTAFKHMPLMYWLCSIKTMIFPELIWMHVVFYAPYFEEVYKRRRWYNATILSLYESCVAKDYLEKAIFRFIFHHTLLLLPFKIGVIAHFCANVTAFAVHYRD